MALTAGELPHGVPGRSRQVERLRQKLHAAALPAGFCDLPVTQQCEFSPTPCYDCALFRTSPVHLPMLRREDDETRALVEETRAHGDVRLLELDEGELGRLDEIVGGLERIGALQDG